MWRLVNHTPYAADRAFVRDREGSEVWLVVVKGTYRIGAAGSLELAEEQMAVCLAPEYRGEPGKSSLLYDTDLVLGKPGTDVILHGHAHAPGGRPADRVDVVMRVGQLSKRLRVFGDRYWEKGKLRPCLTEPEPFDRMPIVYERAFGGSDPATGSEGEIVETRNPVGTGFATAAERVIGIRGANIEDPEDLISNWRQRPRPAGYGPIAPDWSPRVELAGTYDRTWEETRQPLLPLDFDERHFQCAPHDQQVAGHLGGGEPVELHNLTGGPQPLRFALPRVYLTFRTFFGAASQDHRAKLHTVILEPDHPRVIMVWQTSLPCHNFEDRLERTVITEKEYL